MELLFYFFRGFEQRSRAYTSISMRRRMEREFVKFLIYAYCDISISFIRKKHHSLCGMEYMDISMEIYIVQFSASLIFFLFPHTSSHLVEL